MILRVKDLLMDMFWRMMMRVVAVTVVVVTLVVVVALEVNTLDTDKKLFTLMKMALLKLNKYNRYNTLIIKWTTTLLL